MATGWCDRSALNIYQPIAAELKCIGTNVHGAEHSAEVSCCCFVFRVSVMVRLQRRLGDLGEPEQPHELEHFRDLGRLDELQVNHASDRSVLKAELPFPFPLRL